MKENDKYLFTINDRIFQLIEKQEVTKYFFSKKTGISQQLLSNLSRGKSKAGIEVVEKILNNYEVNPTWLLTGKGEMLLSSEETEKNQVAVNEIEQDRPQINGYYYPDVSASAGFLFGGDVSNSDRIPVSVPGWEKGIEFINVFGDSMNPIYNAGDIIGIKETQLMFVNYGYAYVVVLEDDEIYLKYIRKGKDDDHLRLVSENEKFDDKEFHVSLFKQFFLVKGTISKSMIS